jgi:quercetin dioxygenase-like cupin family protein
MKAYAMAVGMGLAFVAGLGAARFIPGALAADEPGITAEIVDVPALAAAAFGNSAPNAAASIPYVKVAGATVSVQTGDVPKHFHADANEIQYVVEGSGRFWLGDKEHEVHPGDLILIPKGTVHGGSHATEGRFKMIAIKTPPQRQGDTVLVPDGAVAR